MSSLLQDRVAPVATAMSLEALAYLRDAGLAENVHAVIDLPDQWESGSVPPSAPADTDGPAAGGHRYHRRPARGVGS